MCVCVWGGGGGGSLRRRLTSLAEGPRCIRQSNCCFPYLLITKSTYICTSWSSIKHFRHARRCKREPPSMTKWTCCGNCISRCLDYMLSENSPLIYFSFTNNVCIFWSAWSLFPLKSSISFPPASLNQLWSPAHCPYSRGIGLHAKTQPNTFDLRVFRCICFFDGEQFGYLGVCMEIRVAHIMIALCPKQSFVHVF